MKRYQTISNKPYLGLNLLCLAILFCWSLQAISITNSVQNRSQNSDPIKSQQVYSSGVPIHFFEEGEGDPVILIHGVTSSANFWVDIGVVQSLSEDYRVIALDCRGHGHSGKPHDSSKYGKQLVRDVVAVMDYLEIEDAHIIGYSMGAEIGLRLVVDFPKRVKSLILGGSGWSDSFMSEVYSRSADALEEHGSLGPALKWMNAEIPGGPFPPPSDEMIGFIDDELKKNQDINALLAVMRAMPEVINLSKEMIEGISVPILGLSGELDPEKFNLERMVGVAADYTLKVIAGVDHEGTFTDPDFIRSITDFLKERH